MSLEVCVGSYRDFIKYIECCTSDASGRYEGLVEALKEESEGSTFGASTYWNAVTRSLLIWMPRHPIALEDIEVTVHELSHACFYILNDVAIRIDAHNNEAYAYLIGYLTKKVFDK